MVAAKSSDKIRKLSRSGRLELDERSFRESDLNDVFLVYIATDDRELNRKILNIAEKRGILSCSVDHNWSCGSFITPTSVSRKEITVAVSSQGSDCRRSRLIKENLARHLDEGQYYLKTDYDAFRHLCLVSAGLLSRLRVKIIFPHN